jgi:Na+/H+ antiporter NhaB
MESNENYAEPSIPTPKLELTHGAMIDLLEARKWANLVAIVGFIGLGIIVVAGLLAGVLFSAMLGDRGSFPFPIGIMGFFYVGMALIYFFPLLYLYRFAKSAQKAVVYQDRIINTSAF